MQPSTFNPSWPFTSGMLQTVLSSSLMRPGGFNPMLAAAREVVLDTVDDIRLLGYLSVPGTGQAEGLVILLHGWEGSADSTYIHNTGKFFYQQGYAVFRLNFRDHGKSHHLNEGIFYAVLIDEVFAAASAIAGRYANAPVFIVGFSLGGNFALRIARKCTAEPISNLRQVVAISPVLDPDRATDRIDQNVLIRRYFIKKWLRSLSIKQALYPERYRFDDIKQMKTIRRITAVLLERYSSFGSVEEYFRGYTLVENALQDLQVPTTLLTAEDDPIIPVDDFKRLKLNASTVLAIQRYGGHNGFIRGLDLKSWYEDELLRMFSPEAGPCGPN